MRGFYWLIEGVLAGCPRPGGTSRGSVARTFGREEEMAPDAPDSLDEDLDWLKQQGIGAILSLTETPLLEETLARHGLAALHLPVPDLTPPTPEQLMRALEFIDAQRALGCGVAVHCLMGQGRTGAVLAAFLIRDGASPEEALRTLRALCPGAVGAEAQERALHAFAARRDWIL